MANKKLFDTLARHGVVDGVSAQQVLSGYDAEKALVLLGACYEAVNSESTNGIATSLFTFLPSSSLAGAPHPCSNVQCRIENAYNLSLFGSMYCDKLVLPNMFDYYYHYKNDMDKPFSSKETEDWFVERFAGDLSVLFQYKPLLDEDIAVIHGTETTVCKGCNRVRLASSQGYSDRLGKIYEEMKPRLTKKIEFYRKDEDTLQIYDLSDYSGGDFTLKMSDSYKKKLNGISKRYPYKLKPSEVIKSDILDLVTQDSLSDLMEKNYYADLQGVTFLSNRQLDADFIEASAKSEGIETPVRSSNLYHSLPFLHDVMLEDVLRIRNNENEAFIVYRDALTRAIKETDATPDELAREYIMPALNQISNTIQNNKKYYRAKMGRTIVYSSVIATAGAIASHYLNTPINPGIIGTAATALISSPSVLPDLADSITTPKEARNDPYYFLWRIRKESRH